MADLAFRVQHVIKTEIDVTVAQLSRNNIETLFGVASFADPHTIRVTTLQGPVDYHAETVIVATGTRPAVSPRVPINGRTILNSDQVLTMSEIPKDADCGGWRRHRRGIYLHVRDAGRARDSGGEAPRLLEFADRRDRGGAVLPSARSPRDAAV
jgi:hypothetical protein